MVTYEEICDVVVGELAQSGYVPAGDLSVPWDAFLRLSDIVHQRFVIPSTTITPIMRRLLFALGWASRKRHLVGVGTFVGYAFAWLLRDRRDATGGPHLESGLAVDLDPAAVALSVNNCRVLSHGERLDLRVAEGASLLRSLGRPIDLLYIDVDDPIEGKQAYASILEAALPWLEPRALVLAHDPLVPQFLDAFAAYHNLVQSCGAFAATCTLPVDECGLVVSVRAG